MPSTLAATPFDAILHSDELEERVEFTRWGVESCPTDPETAECVVVPVVSL